MLPVKACSTLLLVVAVTVVAGDEIAVANKASQHQLKAPSTEFELPKYEFDGHFHEDLSQKSELVPPQHEALETRDDHECQQHQLERESRKDFHTTHKEHGHLPPPKHHRHARHIARRSAVAQQHFEPLSADLEPPKYEYNGLFNEEGQKLELMLPQYEADVFQRAPVPMPLQRIQGYHRFNRPRPAAFLREMVPPTREFSGFTMVGALEPPKYAPVTFRPDPHH